MYLAVLMVLVLMAVTLFTSGTDSDSSTMGYSQVVSYFKANQVTGFALDLNTGVIKLSLKQGDVELPDTTAETMGALQHPGVKSHQRAAEVLTRFLSSILRIS